MLRTLKGSKNTLPAFVASETENGSQRNNCQSSHKACFSPLFFSVFTCIEFNYCVRRLSSLWAEASCLFLKNIQLRMPRKRRRLGLVEAAFCYVTCCHIQGGRKINWQLNDTPCEDDRRHLVAQEEVGSEGLCNEGLMTIHKRFSVR